jgi:hypothetical protein
VATVVAVARRQVAPEQQGGHLRNDCAGSVSAGVLAGLSQRGARGGCAHSQWTRTKWASRSSSGRDFGAGAELWSFGGGERPAM